MKTTDSIRLLFFATPATFAHVTRSIKLIQILKQSNYQITVATGENYFHFFNDLNVKLIPLNQKILEEFQSRIAAGKAPFSAEILQQQVSEDLEIIEKIKPMIIFGDLRNSLSVSARLKKIFYININNAYWSREILLNHPPVWNSFVNKFIPQGFVDNIFKLMGNWIMDVGYSLAVQDINKLCMTANKTYKCYRDFYIDGDLALFFDFPKLIPLKTLHKNQKFMGPIIWSSASQLPSWWEKINKTKKVALVSLGSSGKLDEVPQIVEVLLSMNFEVLLVIGNNSLPLPSSSSLYISSSLPLETIMPSIDILISNGGSPTAYVGLSFGIPVLGIVSNNDQVLCMSHIQEYGAGLLFRYQNWTKTDLQNAVNELVFNSKYKSKAVELQNSLGEFNQNTELNELIKNAANNLVESH